MLPELSKDKEVFFRSAQSFSSDLKSRDLIGLLGSGELYMKADTRLYTFREDGYAGKRRGIELQAVRGCR